VRDPLGGVSAIDALLVRRKALERQWPNRCPRCLRGIDKLSALELCAEVGAFGRFERPASR